MLQYLVKVVHQGGLVLKAVYKQALIAALVLGGAEGSHHGPCAIHMQLVDLERHWANDIGRQQNACRYKTSDFSQVC